MTYRENMQRTSRKNAVFELQQMLHDINRSNGESPKVLPDGIFGPETTKAVKEFQQREGLNVNGKVDFETWDAITRRHKDNEEKRRKPVPFEAFAEELYDELKVGDSCDAVYLLQLLFNKLAQRFLEYESEEISGYFGQPTYRNVISFQGANRFEPTGRVDKRTWNRAARYYNSFKD